MMHESKTRVARFSLTAALLVGLATLASSRSASASSAFPASLQKALSERFPDVAFCVTTCASCHLTTAGGPGNLNKFGNNLFNQPMPGNLIPGNSNADAKVKAALDNYFKATPAANLPQAPTMFPAAEGGLRPSYDADSDGVSDYDELKKLDSPSEPLPAGVGQLCPADAAMYGCGARVAAAPPPVDRLGLFSAGLVVLGLAAFRRRRRSLRAG
jgi:hypothetical protein